MKHVIFYLFISLLGSKLIQKELVTLKTSKIPESKKLETHLDDYNNKELFLDPSLDENHNLENEFEQALELKNKNNPVAVSPEVVKGLISSLKDLEDKTQEDDGLVDDHLNNEPIYTNNWQNISVSENLIKEIEDRKSKYVEIKNDIEDLKTQLENLKFHEENKKRDEEILEIEKKLKRLRKKLNKLRNEKNGVEEEIDELTQKIRNIEADILNLEDKKAGILKDIENLKDIFNQKERDKKEELLEKIEDLINDLIEEKNNLENLQKDEAEHEQVEEEIIELEKEEIEAKHDEHEILIKKLDELISQEKNLAEKQKIEELIQELDNKIFDEYDADKKNQLIQKRFELIRKIRELDEKKMPKIETIQLKQKLNVSINPMFHNLKPVLDKDYADTNDFEQAIANVNNYRRINKVIYNLNLISDSFDEMFKNLPSSVKQLDFKKNKTEEGILVLQKTELFFGDFEKKKNILFTNINEFELTFESLKIDKANILEYFNLKEEFESVERIAIDSKNTNVKEYLDLFDVLFEDFKKYIEKIIDNVKKLKEITIDLEKKIDDLKKKMNNQENTQEDTEDTKNPENSQEKEISEEKNKRRKLIQNKKNKFLSRRNYLQKKKNRILEEEPIKEEIIDKEISKIDICKDNLPEILKIKENFDDTISDLMNLLKNLKTVKTKINENITLLEVELKKPIDKHGNIIKVEEEGFYIYKVVFTFLIVMF